MAIKESRVNGELAKGSMMIAEATMKDSSAMKSIAVLTMLFLPSTAVAVGCFHPYIETQADNYARLSSILRSSSGAAREARSQLEISPSTGRYQHLLPSG